MAETRIDIYRDIATRTGGDIYFGVVGAVRTGKSTFIRRFMELLVVPNIQNEYDRQRVNDELPQSASGKTVMTTQPKFVPNEAATITLSDDSTMFNMNVRMVDCVGYMIPEALGQAESDRERMVITPWFDYEIPFEQAAEIGTTKVIQEHSTIGIVVTTDGTITDIPRGAYVSAEERVIAKMKEQNKPFIIVLNSRNPYSEDAEALRGSLEAKYETRTVALDVMNMTVNDITDLLESILFELPIRQLIVNVPPFIRALGIENPLNAKIAEAIRGAMPNINKMRDTQCLLDSIPENDDFYALALTNIDPATGTLEYTLTPKEHVFYNVLSEECGYEIKDEYHLISTLKDFIVAKRAYDRMQEALIEVERTGYGLVPPDMNELTLEEPEIVRQGNRFGVRLKANATGLHLIRVNMDSEIAPLVGTEEQSEELVKYLTDTFETEPDKIWQTNIFGKPLYDLVCSGLYSKINQLPDEVRMQLRDMVQRIVNERCNNLVCIML
jgi:stage IV sporulation protein A